MTWEEFASRVRTHQIGFMGEPREMKPGRGEFHENPDACICDVSDKNPKEASSQNQSEYSNKMDNDNKEDNKKKDSGDMTDEQIGEDEQNWFDYLDNEAILAEKGQHNGMDSETSVLSTHDQPELDELFSD